MIKLIDFILGLIGQETTESLKDRLAVYIGLSERFRQQCEQLQASVEASETRYSQLYEEMKRNLITREQLEESANIQLEMDGIRVAFDDEIEQLQSAKLRAERSSGESLLAYRKAEKEKFIAIHQINEMERMLRQQKSIAEGWQKHYESLRDANKVA